MTIHLLAFKHTTASLVSFALLSVLLAGNAVAAATEVKALPPRAERAIALENNAWLVLDKRNLALVNADGTTAAQLPLRSKHMDLRATAEGALALVFDADSQRAVPVRVDARKGTLSPGPALPATTYSVETLCLSRDDQGLDSVFLVGKDGRTEQWLLSGETPRLLRELALPPHTEHCRVDDRSHTLYVSETDFGIWAYSAAVEGASSRRLVTAKRPFGPLPAGPGAIAVLPQGIAVLSADNHLHTFRQDAKGWVEIKSANTHRVRSSGNYRQLALLPHDGQWEALLHDGEQGPWRRVTFPWSATSGTASSLPTVQARVQTDSVAQFGDTADDPALWIHPRDPAKSMVLATNKKQGLLRYDLQGKQQQFIDVGRINNVDVRQKLTIDGQPFDLAVATQRDEDSLVIFTIDSEGVTRDAGRVPTSLKDIYGICVHRPASGGLDVFANDKAGEFQQIRLGYQDGRFTGTVVRRFKVASQPEGCVVDDEKGRLFIGEEKRGIWALSADANQPTSMQMVLPVGARLTADVEGLTIYDGRYLIASSQGNNSYVVLDATPPYRYRGAFRIGINVAAGIDGTSDTDGIDVTAVNLGGAFRQGMLVVQDGYKRLPDGPQNFKYVAWQDIARTLGLE